MAQLAEYARSEILRAAAVDLKAIDVREKDHQDYVTEIDLQIEREVRRQLSNRFPLDVVIGEELESDGAHDYDRTWYVDPVDGTNNLVNLSTDVGFSIALYRKDSPSAGLIDLPFRKLRATFGSDGAFVNRLPVARSSVPLQFVGLPGNFAAAPASNLSSIIDAIGQRENLAGIRVSGALAPDLVDVALGRLSARISLGAKPVDVAAGVPFCVACGATALDAYGDPWTIESETLIVAHDPDLAYQLQRIVRAALDGEGGR